MAFISRKSVALLDEEFRRKVRDSSGFLTKDVGVMCLSSDQGLHPELPDINKMIAKKQGY